jgi:hypothetical protein
VDWKFTVRCLTLCSTSDVSLLKNPSHTVHIWTVLGPVNQFRCKQVKSTTVLGFKACATRFVTGAVENSIRSTLTLLSVNPAVEPLNQLRNSYSECIAYTEKCSNRDGPTSLNLLPMAR